MLPVLLFLATQFADAPAPPPRPQFLEAGDTNLPALITTCGSPAKNYIIEVNGGGLLAGDFDNDGDHDLVVVDGSTLERVAARKPGFPPRLVRNDGEAHFTSAGDAWAMSGGRWGMGGAAGDVNGDGWLDLVITEWGPDRLILGAELAGEGTESRRGFREATATAGFEGTSWGTSAAFLDYDRDGFLDLAVINYLDFDPAVIPSAETGEFQWKGHPVMKGPEGLVPVHDQLYRGKGDGTFEDATLKAGFRPAHAGFGLGAMTLDFDSDGDTDLFVANDSTPNHLWENRGDGTLAEVGVPRGVAVDAQGREQASMGIATADVDGDGHPEILITNFSGEENAYYTMKGRTFRERASPTGLGGPSRPWLGWGTALADFDLDGDHDACVFNGHVYPQASLAGTDTSYEQLDQLYRNVSQARTTFEPEALSDSGARVSRTALAADFDGDGDLDLAALQMQGPVRLLLNRGAEPGQAGHWLRVALRSSGPNRQALGASLVARWQGGSSSAEIRTAGGFQAAVPAEAHFGLGPVDALKELEVRWPSGAVQRLADVAVDRLLVLEEPK